MDEPTPAYSYIRISDDCIHIHKSVIRSLGNPAYITLLENEKNHTLAIVPCDETHAMSFKVPKDLLSRRKAKLRIYSKEFVSVLKERYCIEPDSGITIKGEYIERLQAVVFRFRCYKQNGFVVLET